jgi:hypothetical protein
VSVFSCLTALRGDSRRGRKQGSRLFKTQLIHRPLNDLYSLSHRQRARGRRPRRASNLPQISFRTFSSSGTLSSPLSESMKPCFSRVLSDFFSRLPPSSRAFRRCTALIVACRKQLHISPFSVFTFIQALNSEPGALLLSREFGKMKCSIESLHVQLFCLSRVSFSACSDLTSLSVLRTGKVRRRVNGTGDCNMPLKVDLSFFCFFA